MLGVRSHYHFNLIYKVTFIQSDSRGKVIILVCDSISSSVVIVREKVHMNICLFLIGN